MGCPSWPVNKIYYYTNVGLYNNKQRSAKGNKNTYKKIHTSQIYITTYSTKREREREREEREPKKKEKRI